MKIDKERFAEIVKENAKKNKTSEEKAAKDLMSLGPQFIHGLGALFSDGWRAGYTKPSIEKRREERRKKGKLAKQARKRNRGYSCKY